MDRVDLNFVLAKLKEVVSLLEQSLIEEKEDKDLECKCHEIMEKEDIVNISVWKNNPNSILQFLALKRITITANSNTELSHTLDKLSLFMGNKYNEIAKVYNALKSTITSGRKLTISIKDLPSIYQSSSCQLCHQLYALAFLIEYKYKNSPYCEISLKVNRIPEAINFLSGNWFEIYIKNIFISYIDKYSLWDEFSFLMNPQVKLPNGSDFEFDHLFKVQDNLFWFECKTTNYQEFIYKYKEVRQVLNIDVKNSCLILSEISDDLSINLSKTFNFNIFTIDRFKMYVNDTLKEIASFLSEESA